MDPDSLKPDATENVVTNAGTGSPNRLLFVDNGWPDFSLGFAPVAGATDPGGSVSTTVTTTTTTAPGQSVSLSASGLPAGATAAFNPATVTSGGSSTLTIATSGSTPAGVYPIAVTGAGASSKRVAIYQLTVQGPRGCAGSTGADVPIEDFSTAESAIPIDGCASASASSTVAIHIAHTYIGDLSVRLVAPDGTEGAAASPRGPACTSC